MSEAPSAEPSEGGRSVSVSRRSTGRTRAYSRPRRVASARSPNEKRQPSPTARQSSSDEPENQCSTQRQLSVTPVRSRTSSAAPAERTACTERTLGASGELVSAQVRQTRSKASSCASHIAVWRGAASSPTSPTQRVPGSSSQSASASEASRTHQGWSPAASATFFSFPSAARQVRNSSGVTVTARRPRSFSAASRATAAGSENHPRWQCASIHMRALLPAMIPPAFARASAGRGARRGRRASAGRSERAPGQGAGRRRRRAGGRRRSAGPPSPAFRTPACYPVRLT